MDERAEEKPATTPPSIPRLSWFIVRQMGRHKVLLGITIAAAFAIAAADILSVSLIIPFIAIIAGSDILPADHKLNFLLPDFTGMGIGAQLRAVAVGLVAIQLVRALFSYTENRTSAMMALLIERDLRQDVFDEIMASDVGFVQRERTANLLMLMQSYPRQAAAIADIYLGSLSKIALLVGLTFMMITVSPQLTALAIGLGFVTTLLITGVRVAIRRLARQINTERVMLQQIGIETLQGMKVIRAFGREGHTRARFLGAVRRLQRQSYKRASLSALAPQLQKIISISLIASIIIGATFVLSDLAGFAASLMIFLIVIFRMLSPISGLAKQQTKILGDLPAVEEILTFLESPKPKMRSGDIELGPLRDGIRFERVGYAYAPDAPPVLHDVTFTIPRGKVVALVGASGSGKSTLTLLAARLADPTSGAILVDGVDLKHAKTASWRRRIAIVSQDPYLFNLSVRENIRFGRLEATDAEVEEAAKLADAHAFILQLEEGYDTPLGDRGTRLSGGQAQRLAIARALVADPDLLILDEATSALDAATERVVQTAIERASQDRTVLAIAHRLATVRDADEIIVLDQGRIVERGTHADLVARGGRYAEFVSMQDMGEGGVRRVPVDGPAPPPTAAMLASRSLRLVIDGSRRMGAVVDASGGRREVRLHESNGHVPEGDVAVLRPGSAEALVTLDGATHAGVPIYAARPDGTEHRSRVVAFRKPPTGLQRFAQRFFDDSR